MYIIYTHTHTNTLNKGREKVLFYDRMPIINIEEIKVRKSPL